MFAIYAMENALTVVLALALWPRFGDRGLAAAFVGPYTVAALVTAAYLHRKVVPSVGSTPPGRSPGRWWPRP